MIIIRVALQNKHHDSAESDFLTLAVLYLVLLWLLNVRNVQIFCFKTYSLKHFGVTNREQRHIFWCSEVMCCAHVISEIRTLVSYRCLDQICTESKNPEPGLVCYVGISEWMLVAHLTQCATMWHNWHNTDLKHSAASACYKPNRKQLLIDLEHE